MDKPLEYKNRIISYLEEYKHDADVIEWIGTQPEEEQPNYLRGLKILLSEMAILNEPQVELSNELDDKIEQFEISMLARKYDKAQFVEEIKKRYTTEDAFGNFMKIHKEALKSKIESNPKNEELLEFAQKFIQLEKNEGSYNPDDWKSIL